MKAARARKKSSVRTRGSHHARVHCDGKTVENVGNKMGVRGERGREVEYVRRFSPFLFFVPSR